MSGWNGGAENKVRRLISRAHVRQVYENFFYLQAISLEFLLIWLFYRYILR
jgi:hypothetical protein